MDVPLLVLNMLGTLLSAWRDLVIGLIWFMPSRPLDQSPIRHYFLILRDMVEPVANLHILR
jgi:hypothetical protein